MELDRDDEVGLSFWVNFFCDRDFLDGLLTALEFIVASVSVKDWEGTGNVCGDVILAWLKKREGWSGEEW